MEAGARVAYVAGQVSVDGNGDVVAANDLGGQTPVVFGNLEAILSDLGATFADVIELRTYIVGRKI